MLSRTATSGHGPVAVAQPGLAKLLEGVPSLPHRWSFLRKLVLATAAVLAVLPGGVGTALAADQCVGSKPGCLPTVQAALDVAHDGDAIRIGRGTFDGGITIDASVQLIGAGAQATVIRGGGPVVTIGVFDAPSAPTVTIKGVTITGGLTTSSRQCGPVCGQDYEQATALGGGIEIPPATAGAPGATVTIADSVITGNRVAGTSNVPSVRSICPDGRGCPFALAGGGGIDNWGSLTLRDTRVSDNQVGGPRTSDAHGAGIISEAGSLALIDSVVTRNRAIASAPIGRFADAAGIFAVSGTLTIIRGAVTRNVASLSSALPSRINQSAAGGGILATGDTSTTIIGATIDHNRVMAANADGDAIAFSEGLQVDGPLVLRDGSVRHNHVTATTATGSAATADADSGAGELNADSTISNMRFIGNSVRASAPAGTARATNGAISTAAFDATTLSDSVVNRNRATAKTTTGTVALHGAGVSNGGTLTLRNTTVTRNSGRAIGPTGEAQGGGIWNGPYIDGPIPRLALVDSRITHNALLATPTISIHGAGLFTTTPVSLDNSVIARNSPDQCYGC